MSAWNESAERKATMSSPSCGKLTSRAGPAPSVSATTVLVVPKSIPMAGVRMIPSPTPNGPAPEKRASALCECLEVAPDQASVDVCQLPDLRHRHALVHGVHGGAHQSELDYGAKRADETGVGGAAGGGKLGPAPGRRLHRIGHHLHEPAGLGEEGLAAHLDARGDLAGEALARPGRLGRDPVAQRLAGVSGV